MPLIILFVVSSGVTFYLLRRKVYLPIQNMVNNLEAMLPSSEKEPVRTRGELTRLQQNIEEMFSENCAFKLRESQSNGCSGTCLIWPTQRILSSWTESARFWRPM